ncbi:DsbA family protein [Chitinophaga pendula]|uniref:DsbA family protein n=1 Tax=Chitinophaga TaxID=79328 RepID=UPI000BAEE77B|nr:MULTISPECIES: DsbA family protein [Chitinophaga]ASZ12547.1 disulfide bond formation protein DsbA [Chitinophaga sp. MD30]UCJ09849.1 DsbA family protein [Chitinophaga pendula]
MTNKTEKVDNQIQNTPPVVEGKLGIVYYTDPLCCWSWVFEPVWEALQTMLAEQATFRYCMGGLIPSWEDFYDNVNDVSKPIQMGAVFMQAAHLTGQQINSHIWFDDPPASSYPACLAVKAAALQSEQIAARYLKEVRHTLMIDGLNIARKEVLVNIAMQMKDILNTERFLNDLSGQVTIANFKKDLEEIIVKNIRRFPSLVITNAHGRGVIMVGNRPLDAILSGIDQLTR